MSFLFKKIISFLNKKNKSYTKLLLNNQSNLCDFFVVVFILSLKLVLRAFKQVKAILWAC